MKVIIMGCGKMGEQVARLMDAEGHEVVVIDNLQSNLDKLASGFKGRTVKGIGFDREILIQAGIEEADAFAAASSNDNANVIAARIARNIFRVPRVVARLFDPRRAEVYQRLGLLTISSTTWGAERIRELLTHSELDPEVTFGSGEVCLLSVEAPPHLVGRFVINLEVPGEITVPSITRQRKAFIPISGTELQTGDILHLSVAAEAMERVKQLLNING